MRHHLFVATFAALTLLSLTVQPAAAQRNAGPQVTTPGPIPRGPDGHPLFYALPGGKGLWTYPLSDRLEGPDLVPNNPPIPGEVLHRKDPDDIPFQPWAKALFEFHVITRLEPYTRCKPSGGPRQISTAYGTQLLDFPELKRFFILQTGGSHSYRTIYMDGRQHPADLSPSYYGHSIGRWEGDALVVDTVGFNEKMWIDSLGTPTTNKLHLIEKFTRVSMEWTRYEVTIDDPGAYTATWTSGFYLKLAPDVESFEYICQENNSFHVLTGDSGLNYFEDPSSRFIP